MTVHAPTRADQLPVTEDLANLTVFGLVAGKTHKTKEGALASYLGDVTLEKIEQAIAALNYVAADILTKLKTVDGTGSGLDADLFRGLAPSEFATKNDAALTGEPTAPTPPGGDNTNRIATTAFAKALFDDLINAAPGAMDTLGELAEALGEDPNFATTMTAALAAKAPLASAVLTGTPTAPTADVATNNQQLATTAFVKLVVAQLVDTAPDALNTLQELAASLGNDSDFANTMLSALAAKANSSDVYTKAETDAAVAGATGDTAKINEMRSQIWFMGSM